MFKHIRDGLDKAKSYVLHFFRETKEGQFIEHIGYQVVARGGMHDFLVKIEHEAVPVLQGVFGQIQAGKAPGEIFVEAEKSVADLATKNGHEFKTNWLKWATSTFYERIVADAPQLAALFEAHK
jgi:hypothetical protein